MSSPLILVLAVMFLVLIVVGFQLFRVIRKNAADKLFNQAVANLDEGEFRNAIRRFEEFMDGNRRDPRTPKARVLREMANVRQYASSTGTSWDLALEAEREMYEKVGDLEDYRDVRSDSTSWS